MTEKARILIIDDEPKIRQLLQVGLKAHLFDVQTAGNGIEGIARAQSYRPDLLILDMGLPDMDGLDVIKKIRQWSLVPIIILSVRGQELEKVQALDAGADDYLTKPFGMGELIARIRVALRHGPGEELQGNPVVQFGDLNIDLVHRKVSAKNQEVKLTPIEFALLKCLAQNGGKVMTHHQLLTKVWGDQYQEENHYLRIFVRQLRKKIESDPTQPKHIITEAGIGYRLI